MKTKYLHYLLIAVLLLAIATAAVGDSNFTNLVASGDVTVGDDLSVTDDTTLTDDVGVGGDLTVTGTIDVTGVITGASKLTINDNALIDGDADEVTLTVQGYVTPTTSLFVVENSAGTDKFNVDASGNITAAGTLAVTGASTLTGNATIVGTATLSRTTSYEVWATTIITSGAIAVANSQVLLDVTPVDGTIAATLAAPTAGTQDGLRITITSADATAHTITATTIGFNALDAAGDVCTLGGAAGDGITVVALGGEWWIVENRNCTLS